jgi:HlyD family secretion protein
LVKDFSTEGAPIAVRVALDRNPRTPTGYAWAGGQGPEVPLTSGTLAAADVTVERQAPITFALPFLRGLLGQ